jgi:hypothetical protein
MRSDGSIKRRAYLGTKVDGWEIEVSQDGTIATLSMELSASTPQGNQFDSSTDPTATAFPAPTDSQLPINPYVFLHASGGLTIGSSRTQFQSIKVRCKNQVTRRFWANRFVNLMRFVGRSCTLEAVNFYAATPDDRTSYEGLLNETTSFALNNGGHSITINMNTASVITTFEDQLPLNDLYTQTMTVSNQWDSTAGSDLALSFT